MTSYLRPTSFGIETPEQLFTDRQLCVFGHAFRWLRTVEQPQAIRRGLLLATSNALTTNNRLCGYATDYGRIAPLFSVRSYSLPALAVELNPLHPSAGRGTLLRCIERVVRSTSGAIRRYVWSPERQQPRAVTLRFPDRPHVPAVVCASAVDPPAGSSGTVDLCLFDPPFFDYIAYSELSEFYRSWLSTPSLGGSSLLPDPGAPVTSFAPLFARCLQSAVVALRPGRPLVLPGCTSS